MQIFTIKLGGLKKNKNKHVLDCMDEFEYFSGSKKSIIKTENQRVPNPRPTNNNFIFSFSAVIGRKFLKHGRKTRVIQDKIMKKQRVTTTGL